MNAWPKNEINDPTGYSKSYSLAYVAVPQIKTGTNFEKAIKYVDFFILLYALKTGEPCTFFPGVGHPLKDLGSLGKKRVSFSNFEHIENEDPPNLDSISAKPVLETASFFRELEYLQQDIMKSFIGLSLRYYYYALQASRRGRVPEITINLSTALEALVSTGSEYRSNLRKRVSALIQKDSVEGAKISKELADLYSARSRILHGVGLQNNGGILRPQLRSYFTYTRRSTEKVIKLRNLNKKELVRSLDE